MPDMKPATSDAIELWFKISSEQDRAVGREPFAFAMAQRQLAALIAERDQLARQVADLRVSLDGAGTIVVRMEAAIRGADKGVPGTSNIINNAVKLYEHAQEMRERLREAHWGQYAEAKRHGPEQVARLLAQANVRRNPDVFGDPWLLGAEADAQ